MGPFSLERRSVIGGVDNTVRTSRSLDVVWWQETSRAIFAGWPGAVLEESEVEGVTPILDVEELLAEFFVYRTIDDYESWSSHGATPENEGSMIHFIVEDHQVTWVTGEHRDVIVDRISESVRLGVLDRY